jgi:uncharacterized phage protein (TIGR02216 family)
MARPEARGFDWAGLMRAGIHGRGLTPAVFWALTPAELMLILGPGGPAPMGRAGLDALAARYPDNSPRGGEGSDDGDQRNH